jgi:hypothetical protein
MTTAPTYPPINEGQFHVAERRGARQQIESLEYKSNPLAPDFGQLVIVQLVNLHPFQIILA